MAQEGAKMAQEGAKMGQKRIAIYNILFIFYKLPINRSAAPYYNII